MARIARKAYPKPGSEAEYERWHRQVWPAALQAISRRASATVASTAVYDLGQSFSCSDGGQTGGPPYRGHSSLLNRIHSNVLHLAQ